AWTLPQMLAAEKKSLGFYITAHPLDSHSAIVSRLAAMSLAELNLQETGARATIAGLVTGLQLRTTKKGDRFAIFRLEDQSGSVKCVVWPEPFRRHGPQINEEAALLVTGRAEISEDSVITVIVEKIGELGQAIQQKARELIIRLPSGAQSDSCDEIRKLLETSKGECDVFLEVVCDGVLVRMRAH